MWDAEGAPSSGRDGGDVKGEGVSRGAACHTPEAGDMLLTGISIVSHAQAETVVWGKGFQDTDSTAHSGGILGTRKSGAWEEGAAGRGLLFPAVTYTGAQASTGG